MRGFFSRNQNSACRILAGGLAAITRFGDGIDIGFASIHCHIHIGDFALHELKISDGLPELFALMHIRHHDIKGGLHNSQRASCQNGAFIIKTGHQNIDAFADGPQNIFLGHFAVFENKFGCIGTTHAELVELLRRIKTLHAFFDYKGCHATRARIRIGLGVDDQCLCLRPVGNPHFGAIEDVAVPFFDGTGAHGHHV